MKYLSLILFVLVSIGGLIVPHLKAAAHSEEYENWSYEEQLLYVREKIKNEDVKNMIPILKICSNWDEDLENLEPDEALEILDSACEDSDYYGLACNIIEYPPRNLINLSVGYEEKTLEFAVTEEFPQVIKSLTKNFPNSNFDKVINSLLDAIIENKSEELVSSLIRLAGVCLHKNNANLNTVSIQNFQEKILFFAVTNGYPSIINAIANDDNFTWFDFNARLNNDDLFDEYDENLYDSGFTALHLAAKMNKLDVVNALIRAGATIFALDNFRNQPYKYAPSRMSLYAQETFNEDGGVNAVRYEENPIRKVLGDPNCMGVQE